MRATGSDTQPRAERGMRADARRNYERLLSAAAAAFAEHGADDVSLEEIARRAGVGIGTLYRDQVEALRARADELLRSVPPGAALATWLGDLLEFGRTKRNLTSALLTTLTKDSELLSSCSSMMRGAVTDVLGRAQEAGAARADTDPADLLRLVHAISLTTDWAPGDHEQADRRPRRPPNSARLTGSSSPQTATVGTLILELMTLFRASRSAPLRVYRDRRMTSRLGRSRRRSPDAPGVRFLSRYPVVLVVLTSAGLFGVAYAFAVTLAGSWSYIHGAKAAAVVVGVVAGITFGGLHYVGGPVVSVGAAGEPGLLHRRPERGHNAALVCDSRSGHVEASHGDP